LATTRRLGLEMDPAVRSRYLTRFRLSASTRAAGASLETALQLLRRDPAVRIAEPDFPRYASALPNDPRFPQLWGLQNTGQTNGVPDADIDAPEAWEVTPGSSRVIVAVIDTGVDYTHPDLRDNILRGATGDVVGWDFVNEDANPMDDNSHGTHVAGTIGAVGNNGVGVIGVCPAVRIMPVKFLGADGSGSTSNAVLAIDFAVEHGARILNCSWGGGGVSDLLLEAIQRAKDAGVLVVAAAGNEGRNNDENPSYPANYNQFSDNVLSIAATDSRDALAGFSNYGRDTIDLCAPGVGIVSTLPRNSYGSYSGTSMATPHVSGAAALLLSRYPELSVAELRYRLIFNADSVPELAPKVTPRRLNAAAALVEDFTAPDAPRGLTATHLSATGILLSWTASGDDGAAGRASGYELRVSDRPLWDGNFLEATPARWLPTPAVSGTPESYLLSLLTPGQSFYVALRAVDKAGNYSPVAVLGRLRASESSAQVSAFADDAEGGTRFSGDHPWAVTKEAHFSGGRSYTDSPGSPYALNADTSLTQRTSVTLSGFVPVLRFQARTDLEPGFDFLYVEATNDDGATWTRLDLALTGTLEWSEYTASLGRFYGQAVRIRFRLVSDDVVSAQGVWLDDITISGSRLLPLATSAPAAPADLQVTELGAEQVSLEWVDRSDNETSFKIERRAGNGAYAFVAHVGADFTSFVDTTVAANTLYTYRIRASNAAGDSPAAAGVTVLTAPAPPPPPGLLHADGDASGIELSWHSATGAQSYRIKRSLNAGGPYEVLSAVEGTSYRDEAVVAGVPYFYVVSSLGSGGESVDGNEASATAGLLPPDPPTRVRARAQSGQVVLTWSQPEGEDVVTNRIYRRFATGGDYTLLATVSERARYVDRRPGRGSYLYRVTAIDAQGQESIMSEEAAVSVGALRGRHQ
jgi:subtilisin family serine protease